MSSDAEDYTNDMRGHLQVFDSDHLHKLMVMYYDRWNWISGNDHDEKLIYLISDILKERGDRSPIEIEERGITFICEEMRIKNPTNYNSDTLFTYEYNGQLNISYELKTIIVEMLLNELRYGDTTLKSAVLNAVETSYRDSDIDNKISKLEKRLAILEAENENGD